GGPLLDEFFKAVTFTGEEMFYLLFVPILFWAVDQRVGARVGFAYLITAYLNPVLKDLFDLASSQGGYHPRPCTTDPGVSKLECVGSGMPSGHAQSSVFVWGTLAWQVGRGWLWGFAVLWIALVGFSRVYLGMHYPHQVVAGWLIGAILLALFIFLDPRFETWIARRPFSQQLTIAIGFPVLLALAWPRQSTVASAAVMGGFGSGLVLIHRYCPYSAQGLWWQRVLRAAIGLAGLLALYVGLGSIAPAEGTVADWLYYATRFVRYAVLGLWISFGAPWVFNLLAPIRQPEPDLEPRHA
ncbi:MAG: phosphatase PAP2 family protein, partial [Candidatus Promineifilaceae bacterium]